MKSNHKKSKSYWTRTVIEEIEKKSSDGGSKTHQESGKGDFETFEWKLFDTDERKSGKNKWAWHKME